MWREAASRIRLAPLVLGAALLALAMVVRSTVGPYERPFYLDDRSIGYPLVEDTVPYWAVVLVTLPAALVSAAAQGLATRHRWPAWPPVSAAVHAAQAAVTLVAGQCLCVAMVEALKPLSGAMRPHFLAACRPDPDSGGGAGAGGLAVYRCTSGDSDAVDNARRSFPSGHTATACYQAAFVAIHVCSLAAGLPSSPSPRVSAASAATVLVAYIYAVAVSVSRYTDYRHHLVDVVAGAGLAWATAAAARALLARQVAHDEAVQTRGAEEDAPFSAEEGTAAGSSSAAAAAAATAAARRGGARELVPRDGGS